MLRDGQSGAVGVGIATPRWKELYRIGGIFYFIQALIVIFAIIAFFIWPYQPGSASTTEVFATLQSDRLGGLMALDLLFLIGTLLFVPPLLAMYVALKNVNESYALLALVLGLVGVVALIPARPITELVTLSNQYAATTTDTARSEYLAAGDALLVLFDGTAWLVSTIFIALSGLISALLMLRSNIFSKATAYIGIMTNCSALGFFIPFIGIPLLFLATLGGLALQYLIGRRLLQLARTES